MGVRLAPLISIVLFLPLAGEPLGGGDSALAAGFASIIEKDVVGHLNELAAPHLEGRDSPSEGLFRAGEYIIARLKAAGVEPVANQSYRMAYTLRRPAPTPDACLLAAKPEKGEELVFALEEEYVPLPSCPGEGDGRLSFYGFGITESDEKRYDDLKGRNCRGEIVMVLESEPRHKKLFDGPVITAAGDVYAKVKALEERGAQGVLVVRRPPAEVVKGADGKPLVHTPLGFRYTWADWVGEARQSEGEVNARIPALEISASAATRLLGEDVLELAATIERTGKPLRRERKDLTVTIRAGLEEKPVPIDNIVGLVRGTDPALANEYLVLGAHYDHIGVDAWGRIGCGADDNGSGSAGLIELAEAFALAKPARSVLFAWFSAEEDGLEGSKEFCERPPVPLASIVAMLNMDMIGRGPADEVVVIGTHQNPYFEDVLKDAKKLQATQVKKIYTDKAQDLWNRSDQYSFHEKGVPALFFTEVLEDNPEYHTYRDTIDLIEEDKVVRTVRLVFNTAWLIANDSKRPPPP